jgi:hypothetical protein
MHGEDPVFPAQVNKFITFCGAQRFVFLSAGIRHWVQLNADELGVLEENSKQV